MRFEVKDHGWKEDLCKHFLELSKESVRERFFVPVKAEQIIERCDNYPPKFVLFAKEGKEIIGAADVYSDGEDLEIGISVKDEHQGKGYGGQLFNRALDYARTKGYRRMKVVYAVGNHAVRKFCVQNRAQTVREQGLLISTINLSHLH